MRKKRGSALLRDIGLFSIAILVAILLAEAEVFEHLITATEEMKIVSALIAGFFFTFFFTIAPAMVALGELAHHGFPPMLLVTVGATGALLGDLVIFMFMRNRIAVDVDAYLKSNHYSRVRRLMRTRLFKLVSPIIGGLIIASPFPDEIGLALMGLSKAKLTVVIPVSLALNALGILGIIYIARQFTF